MSSQPEPLLSRYQIRRLKENEAFSELRDHLPITKEHVHLSKQDCLTLARNYITALQNMLETNREPTPVEFGRTLCQDLSLVTVRTIAEVLQVDAHHLIQPVPPVDHLRQSSSLALMPTSSSDQHQSPMTNVSTLLPDTLSSPIPPQCPSSSLQMASVPFQEPYPCENDMVAPMRDPAIPWYDILNFF